MTRFRGIMTKYLNNYLDWNNQVVFADVTDDEKEYAILNFIVSIGLHILNRKTNHKF